ncbi:MAG: ferrochelatase [Gammaproteobacteria bacterium]|nr:ferrochelatase [Gammaproteobacteria bacterium]
MSTERIGILLVNTGTPQAAEVRAVRAFLRRFLADRRVVDLPRALWLPLLYGLILILRPAPLARRYRLIWSASGSPLRDICQRLRTELAIALNARMLAPLSLGLGMLYSDPDVGAALRKLRAEGALRLLVLPLFPQYCSATTGAVLDQVNDELRRWPSVPDVHFVADYHDHPGYIEALRASVAAHWEKHGRTPHLLISFHGIPERYRRNGDPYFERCQASARLLADELLLSEGSWSVSFQSRFGPAEWLKPYTRDVLTQMPARGVREVTVVCPGFAVDCLETLEEIAIGDRAAFLSAGGERFEYVPALNESSGQVNCLADLISRHCQAWTDAFHERPPVARGTSA